MMSATQSSSLSQAQLALEQHRHQFGRRRIPEAIRQQILNLLPLYPRKQVVNTLGISYKMLCHWERENISLDNTPDPNTLAFVSLPIETSPTAAVDDTSAALELRLSEELTLAFNGTTAVAQCLQLLQGLGYGHHHTRALADEGALV